MICLPVSLLDSHPATLIRGSDPWNFLPSWPLTGESSNFQSLGLSYPIWEMGLAGLAPQALEVLPHPSDGGEG